MPIKFTTCMILGLVFSPVTPSDFLVLDEPSPIYTEMNWKDLNHSINEKDGSHYLHFSEAHTEGYNTDTFYAHRVEFSNGDPFWFLNDSWGNGNDRDGLLFDFLQKQELFSYKEHAYTAYNWNTLDSDLNLIRIGQIAAGELTLIAIDKSSRPALESCAAQFSNTTQSSPKYVSRMVQSRAGINA